MQMGLTLLPPRSGPYAFTLPEVPFSPVAILNLGPALLLHAKSMGPGFDYLTTSTQLVSHCSGPDEDFPGKSRCWGSG